MADRKITLKRNNSGTTEVLYPTTTIDQLLTSDGSNAVFSGNKIKVEYLPDSVFDSLLFASTLDASGNSLADQEAVLLALDGALFSAQNIGRNLKGSYFVINGAGTISESTTGAQASISNFDPKPYFTYNFKVTDQGDTASPSSSGIMEIGDWIVIENVTGDGTVGTPYSISFSVVSNTYESATTSLKGIVELATNEETSTGTDTERAVTPAGLASVLTNYVTTDNDTTYSISMVEGESQGEIEIDLTAGGSGSGTESVRFTAGTNIGLTLSSTNTMEIGFTGTIPTIQLNGSNTTSPGFYAPTTSGTAGSSSVSRQALFSAGSGSAPTWVDAPKVFYDDTTGWLHGDIVIDVDA